MAESSRRAQQNSSSESSTFDNTGPPLFNRSRQPDNVHDIWQTLAVLSPNRQTIVDKKPPRALKPLPVVHEHRADSVKQEDVEAQLQIVNELLVERDWTPHSRNKLVHYRDQLQDVVARRVDFTDVRQNLEAARLVLNSHLAYSTLANNRIRELERDLVYARRLEIYVRYGDYLAELPMLARQSALKMIKEGKATIDGDFAGQWTEISAKLKREERSHPQQYHDLLRPVAEEIGFPFDHMIFCIHHYAHRNALVHADIDKLLYEQKWQEIGDKCTNDLTMLESLFTKEGDDPEISASFRKIITDFRSKYVEASGPTAESWMPIRPLLFAIQPPHSITELNQLKKAAKLDRGLPDNQLHTLIEKTIVKQPQSRTQEQIELKAEKQAEKEVKLKDVQTQLNTMRMDLMKARESNEARDADVEAMGRELGAKDRKIEAKDREIEAKDRKIEAKDREIEAKDREIEAKDREIEAKDREIESLRRQLTVKHEEDGNPKSQQEESVRGFRGSLRRYAENARKRVPW